MPSNILDHLSTWEIAHRWLGHDPDLSDTPPMEVRDLLREITYLQQIHEIPISTVNGVELSNNNNAHEGADLEGWSSRHNKLVDGLEMAWKHRQFDREKLESIHMARHYMPGIAQRLGRSVPEFWFSKKECSIFDQITEELRFNDLTEHYLLDRATAQAQDRSIDSEPELSEGRLKQPQIDIFWRQLQGQQRNRLLCRHFAEQLWAEDPKMTIVSVIGHELIQKWAGGKYYSGKDTLRNWVKDLDPRPTDSKSGRPSKSN